jgi:hypothetical protein
LLLFELNPGDIHFHPGHAERRLITNKQPFDSPFTKPRARSCISQNSKIGVIACTRLPTLILDPIELCVLSGQLREDRKRNVSETTNKKYPNVASPQLSALLIHNTPQVYSRTAGLLEASLSITSSAPPRCPRERRRLLHLRLQWRERDYDRAAACPAVVRFTLFSAMVQFLWFCQAGAPQNLDGWRAVSRPQPCSPPRRTAILSFGENPAWRPLGVLGQIEPIVFPVRHLLLIVREIMGTTGGRRRPRSRVKNRRRELAEPCDLPDSVVALGQAPIARQ